MEGLSEGLRTGLVLEEEKAKHPSVLLCGLPGSGKSTLAKAMAERGWIVANQDELGDRKRCEKKFSEALRRGHRCVVDRCNFDRQQRSHWPRLAKSVFGDGSRFLAVWLDASPDLCLKRCRSRKNHPTLSGQKAADVIRRFKTTWQPPTTDEFFDDILKFKVSDSLNFDTVIDNIESWASGAVLAIDADKKSSSADKIPPTKKEDSSSDEKNDESQSPHHKEKQEG